jgi:glycosyltransferase involved in cell wall biosynthesis
MLMLPSYVLITPARNEAESIELTIKSVVMQTVRPIKWIIVSDGSTDGTDEIVRKYAADQPWIELLRTRERRERHFAGKVQAFNVGYARVQGLDYDAVGNLDADVSFDPGYFSYLLGKLAEDRALGLVGTPFKEGTNPTYDYRFVSIEHVSGACQLFRRECFEQIGGYVPVKGGCIDHIAVISARMKGWKTRTFTDMVVQHHRQMGTAGQGLILTRLKNGQKDYIIGNHPVWELFRAVYQATRKPYVVGSLMLVSGYFWSLIRRVDRPVSDELVAFVRREQMLRLRRILTGKRNASNEGLQRPAQHV